MTIMTINLQLKNERRKWNWLGQVVEALSPGSVRSLQATDYFLVENKWMKTSWVCNYRRVLS